ncbi:DUF4190 domain-containing protein [Streptomyces sp. NPDC052051]|uniref:DUF4190 domain-containing protein n=1 Tax=Streptomyces sp. NPDC052051 TaxID=3154649 RepID=UPI00343B9949
MAIPPPPGPQQPQDPPPQGAYGQPYGPPYGNGLPYQTWGQGYSPYSRPAPVNGLAVAALVLGIMCFLPAVGLILGLIALAQIKRRGERGRGLAIGGIAMSSLGLALLVLFFATGSASEFWEGVKDGAREARDAGVTFSVKKGECFDVPGGSLEGEPYKVRTVSCSGRHQAEVFADYKLTDARYPGTATLTEIAEEKCFALQSAYAMDVWAIPDYVDVYYFTPTRESWRFGDRAINCMFGHTDAKSKLTGSLRRDAGTLTGDQFAYLQADVLLYDALDTVPDAANVEDDLPGHRAWAERVAAALSEQTRNLRTHEWQDDADKPVADQAKALERAREEWRKAAEATDADAFYTHYDKGSALLEGRAAITAREALGLATTPPSHDSDDSEGSGGDTRGEERV